MPSLESTSGLAASDSAVADRLFVRDLSGAVGDRVAVRGWIKAIQHKRDRTTLTLFDRSGEVRGVCEDPAAIEALEAATMQSTVSLLARVRPGRQGAGVELEVDGVESLNVAASPPPLQGNAPINDRLDHRYLDLRSPEKFAIFDVGATVEASIRSYLRSQQFVGIHAPRITGGGSESGAAVFKLPYFDETACLVQSVQFYAQMAIAAGFDRIFDIGPVFRAENSVTNRHATEFTCLHIELAWIDSDQDLMDLEEALVRHVLEAVRDQHGDEIERDFGLPVTPFEEPIPRIPFAEAMELVGGDDREEAAQLSARDERALSKHVHRELGHDFVFVTDYPSAERPFYTKAAEESAGEVSETHSFDLLWRGVEITSGCQREHRFEQLYDQARSHLTEEAIEQYLGQNYIEMFRHGVPPHGGFGIGLDRFTMILLGQASLRETSFVFRGPERFVP